MGERERPGRKQVQDLGFDKYLEFLHIRVQMFIRLGIGPIHLSLYILGNSTPVPVFLSHKLVNIKETQNMKMKIF